MSKIDGDRELVYAGWNVINELIEMTNEEYIEKLLTKLINILRNEKCTWKLECIWSALASTISIMTKQLYEVDADLIAYSLYKCNNFSCEKNMLIKILAINLKQRFEKYLSLLVPSITNSIDDIESVKALDHIFLEFPISKQFIPLALKKIELLLRKCSLNDEEKNSLVKFISSYNLISVD